MHVVLGVRMCVVLLDLCEGISIEGKLLMKKREMLFTKKENRA